MWKDEEEGAHAAKAGSGRREAKDVRWLRRARRMCAGVAEESTTRRTWRGNIFKRRKRRRELKGRTGSVQNCRRFITFARLREFKASSVKALTGGLGRGPKA